MTSPSSSTDLPYEKRMRVFAGPNGSGKSTIIQSIKDFKGLGKPIDFETYLNADDIAKELRIGQIDFRKFNISTDRGEFERIALNSGLIKGGLQQQPFSNSFQFTDGILTLKDPKSDEILAQIVTDFLRKKLLSEHRKISFETVFSHRSKVEIMEQAASLGYKVYLYFVSTESPTINKYRVLERKSFGGHDVPPDKIESRYYRSLDLMFDAAQMAYQASFWDNSVEGTGAHMFAHFKKEGGKKVWDIDRERIPFWFRKYYLDKVGK